MTTLSVSRSPGVDPRSFAGRGDLAKSPEGLISLLSSISPKFLGVLGGLAVWLGLALPAHAADPAAEAELDYVRALNLVEEGSKPEALRLLAESLRLKPAGNPAATLAFPLLAELRTGSSLVLRGHAGGVLCATYSPDGAKIVTGSQDHTARIWDAQTGRELTPPLAHDDDVIAVVFSADGKLVATGSEDKSARVWDVGTGKEVGTPFREHDEIRCVQLSPDGKLLATGSDEGQARVWEVATGKSLLAPPKYHESVFSIAFSPDGAQVLIASGDAKADLFDLKTGKLAAPPMRHENNVYTAVFDRDGTQVLTASADRTAKIWDAKTGKPLGPVFRHGYWVWSAVFNGDATRVVTASWDHTARVWDAQSGKPVTPPLQHADAVLSAVFSSDGTRVATMAKDGTAHLWDATTGEELAPPMRAGDEITMAIFSPDGRSLLTASKDKLVQIHDLAPVEAAPDWLADLADFAAAQVRYDVDRKMDEAKITKLRERLLASTSGDAWEKFGKWYFMEADARPVSPWSTLSLKDYVDGLIAMGDKDSIEYAITLSRDHPAWMMKLVPLREKMGAPAPAKKEKAKSGDND